MSRLRTLATDAAAALVWTTGLSRPARALATRLPIVTFHRVLPEDERRAYPLPWLAVTPDELAWLLGWLGRWFACGTLRESLRRFEADARNGRGDDRPPLAVTFDDAQLDNYLHARPVLARAGVAATFFAPVDAVEANGTLWHDRLAYALAAALDRAPVETRALAIQCGVVAPPLHDASELARAVLACAKEASPETRAAWVERAERLAGGPARPAWDGMASFAQLRALADEGHEIGSHGMSHALLPQLDEAALEHEIGGSRRKLEEALGVVVDSFCYPNGDHDARSVEVVRRTGYARAVTARWGANARGASPFTLRRFDMDAGQLEGARGALSEKRLAWRISGLHPGLR